AATAMFLEDLADLKNAFPARFDLVHVLSREPRDVELFSGRLDGPRLEAILRSLVPWCDIDGYWLCGPVTMVEEHRAVLDRLGVVWRRGRSGLPLPRTTGVRLSQISSRRSWSRNCPTSSPPPTTQMFRSPASATISVCTSATGAWVNRRSAPSLPGSSRCV